MSAMQIVALVAGIIFIQALVWFFILRWLRKKTDSVMGRISGRMKAGGGGIVFGPQPALYRGSDGRFGKVKGNGVIILTGDRLHFEKLTGRVMEINRSEILDASVKTWFRGKTSFATGGKHLVIRTMDGSRTGFLLKNAELWSEKLMSRRLN